MFSDEIMQILSVTRRTCPCETQRRTPLPIRKAFSMGRERSQVGSALQAE
jgi:hypothetical protein